jgi:hypothetical protein
MARQPTSKTARRSSPSRKKGEFEFSTDCPRLVPTGGGQWAYVRGVGGRTVHVRVGSDAYDTAVRSIIDELAGSVAAQRMADDVARLAATYPGCGWELRDTAVDTVDDTEALAA